MRGRLREQAANGRQGYAKRRHERRRDAIAERLAGAATQSEARLADLIKFIKGGA